MTRTLYRSSRPILSITMLLAAACLAVVLWTAPANALDLDVSIPDTSGCAGQRIFIPIHLTAGLDSVGGFQITYNLDRPDVAEFPVDTTIDTMILCVNPPDCTVLDTIIDTTAGVVLELGGTLCENWDFIEGRSEGGNTVLRLTGIANLSENHDNAIAPLAGGIVAHVALDIFCDQPIFNGGQVFLMPNEPFSAFSDPQGNPIDPFFMAGAEVTVPDPVMCDLDYSGFPDAVDLQAFIQCVFFNDCPACDAIVTDFDCDGQTDAVDMNTMIDYLFFNGPEPSCP